MYAKRFIPFLICAALACDSDSEPQTDGSTRDSSVADSATTDVESQDASQDDSASDGGDSSSDGGQDQVFDLINARDTPFAFNVALTESSPTQARANEACDAEVTGAFPYFTVAFSYSGPDDTFELFFERDDDATGQDAVGTGLVDPFIAVYPGTNLPSDVSACILANNDPDFPLDANDKDAGLSLELKAGDSFRVIATSAVLGSEAYGDAVLSIGRPE